LAHPKVEVVTLSLMKMLATITKPHLLLLSFTCSIRTTDFKAQKAGVNITGLCITQTIDFHQVTPEQGLVISG